MDAALRSLLSDKDLLISAVSSSNDLRLNKLQVIEEEVTTAADAQYRKLQKVCNVSLLFPNLCSHVAFPLHSRFFWLVFFFPFKCSTSTRAKLTGTASASSKSNHGINVFARRLTRPCISLSNMIELYDDEFDTESIDFDSLSDGIT